MYLPESHAQMFDILSALRVYAAMHALHGLAEEIDDALMLLSAGSDGRARAAIRGIRLLPGGGDRP